MRHSWSAHACRVAGAWSDAAGYPNGNVIRGSAVRAAGGPPTCATPPTRAARRASTGP